MLYATDIRRRFRTLATSKRLTRVSYFSKSFSIFYFPMILDSPLKINLLCFPKEPCRKLYKCALFLAFSYTVKPPNSGHPKQRTCLQQPTKCLVPIVTIFAKLPPNSGDLLIMENFLKSGRCPLFRGFTVYFFCFELKFSKVKKRIFQRNGIIFRFCVEFYAISRVVFLILFIRMLTLTVLKKYMKKGS